MTALFTGDAPAVLSAMNVQRSHFDAYRLPVATIASAQAVLPMPLSCACQPRASVSSKARRAFTR